MTLTPLTLPPTPPSRSDLPATFITRADDFIQWIAANLAPELNALLVDIVIAGSATNYAGTSTTSLTVGTGSKSLTTQTDKAFTIGQFVLVSNTATPANYMYGQVTAYTASTGAMTVNVASVGGSGTFTAWTIGLNPSAGAYAQIAGAVFTGLVSTPASAAGGAGFKVMPGVAPTTPNNGDMWLTSSGLFARIGGATREMMPKSGGVFSGAVAFTHPDSGTSGAVVIRDAPGDTGGGYIQWTNNAGSSEYCYVRGVAGSFQINGNVHPITDNASTVGLSSKRWSVVYAVTGTINTSDEDQKTWRGAMSPAELAAARAITAELGFYQWNDAISEKGADAARLHFGVRAQRAFAIMEKHVLQWRDYAWCCYDAWEAQEEIPETRDDDGAIIAPGQPARPAGHAYGVRPDQLALFLIAGQEQRLAALEAMAALP